MRAQHKSGADSEAALRLRVCVCSVNQTDGSAFKGLVFKKTET